MSTSRRSVLAAMIMALALAVAACSGGTVDDAVSESAADEASADEPSETADASATEDAATSDDEPPAADAAADDVAQPTVAVAASDLGDILVDGQGRTLYMFLPDQADVPTCTDDCAATWPVFEGPATAGEGADASLVSTVRHPSGATQVTYGGWPLYSFVDDTAAGDVNGQGVDGVWSALGPDGEPVDET